MPGVAVRVPDSSRYLRALESIKSNLGAMDRVTREVASGRRISAPSDDPAATRSLLRTNSALQSNAQFARNTSRARSLVGMEDVALHHLGDVLVRAREVALAQAGSTANSASREIAAREIEGIIAFVQDLGNTRLGDRYIFGGLDVSSPPFGPGYDPADPLPEGNSAIEIAPGRNVPTNHSASEVFGESGVLEALRTLANVLMGNDGAGIAAAEGLLERAHSEVQLLVGEVGSRMNRIDLAESRILSTDLMLLEFRSDLEEVDLAEALSRLTARETAYQAALLATSRMLSLSLAHYL